MNLEKLDEAIAYIEAHPSEHDQMIWLDARCGTTACLAGHVALLAGGEPQTFGYVRLGGKEWHVSDLARHILDLNHDEEEALFYGADGVDEIKRIRDNIAAGGR
jgi:hypothetical protein